MGQGLTPGSCVKLPVWGYIRSWFTYEGKVMPDRTPIVGPQKLNRLGRPAPATVRPRPGTEPEPVRDDKQFLGMGRKGSRLRRLDSRGSAHK
jgi:hypothetical protein